MKPFAARYTACAVSLNVISLSFDPALHLGDLAVRWESLAVAGAILLAILAAALHAGFVTIGSARSAAALSIGHLRRDDLLLVLLGVVPGALVGGRLTDVATHLDFYRANQSAILDPAAGGLGLSGAVVLGALTGGVVARLFDAPVGRWYHATAIPMLVALGLGKAAMVLGGTGQGVPTTTGWATRYAGSGPWGSLGPDIPSVPAQALEAVGVAVIILVVGLLLALGAFRRADGRSFALALGGWAVVRLVVAGSWRDSTAIGGFRVEQVADMGIIVLAILAFAGLLVRASWLDRHPVPVGDPVEPASEAALAAESAPID